MSKWYLIPKDSDLMHHGVKGMKWGVRNEKPSVGQGRSKSGSEYSSRRTNTLSRSSVPSNIRKSGERTDANSKIGSSGQTSRGSRGLRPLRRDAHIPLTYADDPGGGYFVSEIGMEEYMDSYISSGDENSLRQLLNLLTHMPQDARQKYLEQLKKYPDRYRALVSHIKNTQGINPRNAQTHYRNDPRQTLTNTGHTGGTNIRF